MNYLKELFFTPFILILIEGVHLLSFSHELIDGSLFYNLRNDKEALREFGILFFSILFLISFGFIWTYVLFLIINIFMNPEIKKIF